MNKLWLGLSAALIAGSAACVWAAPAVTGDYVEARSCNVYAGPCHFGSEYTTAGREAVMAWRVRHGAYAGQALDGLAAVAVVVGDDNLAVAGTPRRTVFYIDERATPAQREALVAILRARTGADFGRLVAVRAAPIAFEEQSDAVRVSVPKIARLDATKMPDAACCRWPGQLWYDPLARAQGVKVGNAAVNEYDDGLLDVRWTHNGQNSVLFGDFTF
jgi:hypothetical protein